MVPDVAGKGHSFAGAMRYYCHDKRAPGQKEHPTTSERVAWVEMRNLPVDDARQAMWAMIATANQAEALKRRAGVKTTGRRSTAAVYAFSLSWHPDEAASLTRAEMLKAADAALATLGIAHLQCLIVCHRDQPHPHVHCIVNRVDPADGRMAVLSKDRELLSKWAHAYERERGPLLTPKRAEKHGPEAERARADRQRDAAPLHTASECAPQREAAAPIAGKQQKQPSARAMLAQLDAAQRERHDKEWRTLEGDHHAGRKAVYERYPKVEAILAGHRETRRAAETSLRLSQARQMAAHNIKARSLIGRCQIAWDAAKDACGPEAGRFQRIKRAVSFALAPESVRQKLVQKQRAEREALAVAARAQLGERIAAMKEARQAELSALAERQARERKAMTARQDVEKAKIKEAWRRAPPPERSKRPPRQQDRQRDSERQRDEERRRERRSRTRGRSG